MNIEGFNPIYKGVPPFMKYEKGFGYYGVLLEEQETGKLQCHLCGSLALNIAKHLFHKHNDVSPRQYKVETGLNLTTPLMSEKTRKRIRNNFLDLTEGKKQEMIDRLRGFNKELHEKKTKKQREAVASIQMNNRYGTCPEQVKSQFFEVYKKLGRIPRTSELSGRLRYIIETRFGSYEEAVVAWGISREEFRGHVVEGRLNALEARKEKDYFPKYEKEEVKKQYLDFFKVKGRLPTWGEVKTNGMPGRTPFSRAFRCSKVELEKTLA